MSGGEIKPTGVEVKNNGHTGINIQRNSNFLILKIVLGETMQKYIQINKKLYFSIKSGAVFAKYCSQCNQKLEEILYWQMLINSTDLLYKVI